MEVQAQLITNAVVRSVDEDDSVHEAVLIERGRIAAVGSEADLRLKASHQAEVLDAGGRTVVPGFIDAHNHMSFAAFAPVAVNCMTPPLASMDEVLEVIRAHCSNLIRGQWASGFGFDMSKIREQRTPTRYELDEVSPNNPFFLVDVSGHAGYANTAALEAAGITQSTPDPWGGGVERDTRGLATGTLMGTTAGLLNSISWEDYAERDWDHAVELLESKAKQYLAVGLTGVGDACVTAKGAELYRRADESGRLPLTLQQIHGGDFLFARQDLGNPDVLERIQRKGTRMLRGGAMKVFVDRAYPDSGAIHQIHDGCVKHVGTNFYNPREVRDIALRATGLGIDLAVHAMGNCAIDIILDAYEAVRETFGRQPVLRLEHAFVAEARQATRMAELDIDLVANPGLAHNVGDLFSGWRGENQNHLKVIPVRSMIDAGVRVSFASDHPAGTFSPAEIMWTAVARQHLSGVSIEPEEAVTAAEALRAFTIQAAHASGRDSEEGSLEKGKRANLLVLDRDPLTCTTNDLRRLQVDRTYVDGRLAHQRAE